MSKFGLQALGMGKAPVGGMMPGGGDHHAAGGADGTHPGQKGNKAVGSDVADHLAAAVKAHQSGNHKGWRGSVFAAIRAHDRASASGNHGARPRAGAQPKTGMEPTAHVSGNRGSIGSKTFSGGQGIDQRGSGNRNSQTAGSMPKTSIPHATARKKSNLGIGVSGHSLAPVGGSSMFGGTPAGNPSPGGVGGGY